MKKVTGISILIAFVVLMAGGNAFAAALNTRPVGDAFSLSELQAQVFDAIGATSIDAVNDQSNAALFEPTGAGNSNAAYIASISWGDFSLYPIEFGIYDATNPNNRLTLFNANGSMNPGASVTIVFDQGANTVTSVDLSSISIVDQTSWFGSFGFYIYAPTWSNEYFYSEDDLNGGDARFLTYEAKGDMVTIGTKGTFSDIDHWYIAAEAGLTGFPISDYDFTDFVVQMESIRPVPEPATLVLVGSGLAGLAFVRRRKNG